MAASLSEAKKWGRKRCERLIYRIGGLPVAVGALLFRESPGIAGPLRATYAANYWQPEGPQDFFELLTAGMIWPVALLGAACWFTWRNGRVTRGRSGKSCMRQFAEELGAYFSAGVLPPWYYAFELHEGGVKPQRFINRFETKRGYYEILARRRGSHSPLGDKLAFAQRCQDFQVPTVPVLAAAVDGEVTCFDPAGLPTADLFVKPVRGRGGTGAERWDYVGGGHYRSADLPPVSEANFLNRLRSESRDSPRIVQPLMVNCEELGELNNGALSTIRVVTCLDERDHPEVVAAAMRMAVGDNHRVDNFHAGGIASAVDLQSGALGPASNMGMDARLGWLDRHPDSRGRITGRRLPRWEDTCRLAEHAHRAFDDRVVVGWDIAVTPDGPTVVEGNAAPDLDIIQRTRRSGLADSRLCELLRHHLREPGPAPYAAVSMPSSPSLR